MPFDTAQPSYQAFRSILSERTRPIVAWVGAGASAAGGLPGWRELRDFLSRRAEEQATHFDANAKQLRIGLIQSAASQANPWVAFEILQNALGPASFRAAIRDKLAPAASTGTAIPEIYSQLWHLGIKGLLNLNLDAFARRAATAGQVSDPVQFSGLQAPKLAHVIGGNRPFIAYLHGMEENSDSWVLTHTQLKSLLDNDGYRTFISTVVLSHTVLFVGLSVDDVAVGGHLEAITRMGVEGASHFWLTSRGDEETVAWAEANNIRLIAYRDEDGSHKEVAEFFRDLGSYVPRDDDSVLEPVVSNALGNSAGKLPSPRDLVTWANVEDIRAVLNRHATEILATSGDQAYDRYNSFSEEYGEAVHRAWYATTRDGENLLLGYRLVEDVAKGAFGRVYKAVAPNGDIVAIKLLLEDIRKDPRLLKSFRRGVRSMKILSAYGIPGMVAYYDATELPAFVSMEWIEGPTLTSAIQSKLIDSWFDVLKISEDLARILLTAHALPERVLHRDVRPSNVMLKGFYEDSSNWSTVVLDFDLSWHQGATEKSVLYSTAAGYLAPEQVQAMGAVSTRHAAVDSFGFGMTMYFMLTAQDPVSGIHRGKDWETQLGQVVRRWPCREWRSLPQRVKRLILNATQDKQAHRWDMGQIHSEIRRLRIALRDRTEISEADLIAEEIAAHSGYFEGYGWNADTGAIDVVTATGITLRLEPDDVEGRIDLTIAWAGQGTEDRVMIAKSIRTSADRALEKLASGGWTVRKDEGPRQLILRGVVAASDGLRLLSRLAGAIDGAVPQIRIS